ncbi:hypothetical protein ABT278_12425 [Streptomyces sp. NPDC001228]|uniref:hypothetical protein n=1 Tax=unclassified Streptomyces TaxID=2593676 RepID=UPI0033235080
MTPCGAEDHACDGPRCGCAPVRVTVHPPSPAGGRRVHADGEPLGLAHGVGDVAEFLRRAGLEIDPAEVAESSWIDWRGVGPEHWRPDATD